MLLVVTYMAFDYLYQSLGGGSPGRTARFDHLNMIGNLGLASIEPICIPQDSTGPIQKRDYCLSGKDRSAQCEVI
jgi:hypothetical protein